MSRPERRGGIRLTWAGVVPGDEVLLGGERAGWTWWVVVRAGVGGEVDLRGRGGTEIFGSPRLDEPVYLVPVADGPAATAEREMYRAQELVYRLLGGMEM